MSHTGGVQGLEPKFGPRAGLDDLFELWERSRDPPGTTHAAILPGGRRSNQFTDIADDMIRIAGTLRNHRVAGSTLPNRRVVADKADFGLAGARSGGPEKEGGSVDTDSKSAVQNLNSFVWSIAEILRGDFKQFEYGKVILPFVVMRRLDCILESSKQAVLEAAKPYTEDEERSLSEIIKAFNERHGTAFTKEDFLRFEQVNREILDEDMTDMLRNNPPDVVYGVFSQAFFQGAIRLFHRDNEMKSIVLSDSEAREGATRHFFNRALREARG